MGSLRRPTTTTALARKHGLDAPLLRGVLEYVAARTELVRKLGDRFVATPRYSVSARFLLDLYAGAYGRCAAQLPRLMRNAALAPGSVDGDRFARAFDAAGASALSAVTMIVRQLQLRNILDLGCGTATLLIGLAKLDPSFVGWGLEINPMAYNLARKRIRAARIGHRVRVLQGDCTQLRAVLPAEVAAEIRTVTAGDVANAMFADGRARVVTWLRGLKDVLPGRLLLISDYYGRLGRRSLRVDRETLLQDFVQVISGQGVPPASIKEWRTIYEQAHCRLVHVMEDEATTRFIHLLKL